MASTQYLDGHSTKITFASNASVELWEKEVTPLSLEGGDGKDITTMHNVTFKTKAPNVLIEVGECACSVSYAIGTYTDMLDMLNENQLITITFPDGATVAFWGWISEFKPSSNKEGEMPTADLKIIPSNRNDAGAETAPVFTETS